MTYSNNQSPHGKSATGKPSKQRSHQHRNGGGYLAGALLGAAIVGLVVLSPRKSAAVLEAATPPAREALPHEVPAVIPLSVHFTETPVPEVRKSPIAWSFLLHVLLVALLANLPAAEEQRASATFPANRFRLLILTPPAKVEKDKLTLHYRGAALKPASASTARPSSEAPPPQNPAGVGSAQHTLIQPDVQESEKTLADVQVPTIEVWTNTQPPGTIVAGMGSRADAAVPRTPAETTATVPLPSGVSLASAEKSAGRLVSLSEIPLPPEARIAVPLGNQSAPSGPAGEGGGAGPADIASITSGTTIPADKIATPAAGAATSVSTSPDTPAGTNDALVRITRPQTGRHSSVIVGSGPSAAYPEAAGVLSGRVVYTVYLQAGMRKNWILQFCLPAAQLERMRAAGAAAIQPDAPWPFTMARPPAEGFKGDYTLIHGTINAGGRFENLSRVIPAVKPSPALLDALHEWEFRPATLGGQPVSVEALLIIPHPQQ